MKNCCLSHWSALVFWKANFVRDYFRSECATTSPLHVTVFTKAHYYRRKGRQVHLCTSRVQRGAIQTIGGRKVVSPEFAYLQLAAKLPRQKLILLGNLLCGLPAGVKSKPLTTKKKLYTFAVRAHWHYDRRKALAALKYVQDRGGSILESVADMLLELPHHLGGCGLSGGKLNHQFVLNKEGAQALRQASCYADCYYPNHNLILEIDSFKHHSSAYARGRDAERATVLSLLRQRRQITVINIQTSQIYKPVAFKQLLYRLAKIMDRRIRIRCKSFTAMHQQLRALLPRMDSGPSESIASCR